MQGVPDFKIDDEAFFLMTWAEGSRRSTCWRPRRCRPAAAPARTSAKSSRRSGPTSVPRPRPADRAFVWMQGHTYANFANPPVQPMILRGIAWAAKWPIDALMTVRPQGRGGRGGN